MGGSSSKKKAKNTPIPNYSAGLNRPVAPMNPAFGSPPPSPGAQRPGAPMPYGGYPPPGMGGPPMPYGGYPPPGMGGPPMPYGGYYPPYGGPPSPPPSPPPYGGYPPGGYRPPSPGPGNFGRYSPYAHIQGAGGASGYRDTDFAAIAHIAGLDPASVAMLHREYMNLTRGGTVKMDRTVFRQLLRDILMERSNDYVDRAIESIFLTIDQNHDGYIDFPEFVGAFKDVLKQGQVSPDIYGDSEIPGLLAQEVRISGVGGKNQPHAGSIAQQPQLALVQQQQQPQLAFVQQQQQPQFATIVQQPQVSTPFVTTGGLSIVPLASTGIQQSPVVLASAASPFQVADACPPTISFDSNQSSYVIATPGQYLITQPTALQCVPLPLTC